jgi:molybdate transport system ATP-binding protein
MSGLELDVSVRRSDNFRLQIAATVPAGHTVALLGPNGAGKSTAVAAIAGLLPIDTGHIRLDGTSLDYPPDDVFVPADQRRIGVVFQDYLLFPHMSVLENVAFGLRSRGIGKDQALAAARDWLTRLGLSGLEDRKPDDLSGGQSQRVALARALVTEPDLLLLDEPLSALDVTTRTELRRALGEHLEEFQGPRMLITHDPTEAFLLADEVHIIEQGEVTQAGTPDEIRLRPRTPYAADLAGSNFILAKADSGLVTVGDHVLHLAEQMPDGPLVLTIHPAAISIYPSRPEGSPRNTWETTIGRVERLGGRTRLLTTAPLPLTVEVTTASFDDLRLETGSRIWVAIKATEIGVQSDRGIDSRIGSRVPESNR